MREAFDLSQHTHGLFWRGVAGHRCELSTGLQCLGQTEQVHIHHALRIKDTIQMIAFMLPHPGMEVEGLSFNGNFCSMPIADNDVEYGESLVSTSSHHL